MASLEWWRFLRGFLANPSGVASPIPAGKALAAAIARNIDPTMPGTVLELGPGTGAVTAEILKRGVQPSDLVAIESDENFSAFLRMTYPGIRIETGDAFRFPDVLTRLGIKEPLRAVVSGVPVLDKPVPLRKQYLNSAVGHLRDGAPLVQFSYGVVPPIPPTEGVQVTRGAFVWWNIPPLHIWIYRKSANSKTSAVTAA